MRKLLLLGAFAALLAAACGLDNTINQLQSHTEMVGTLLATPPVSFNPASFVDGGAQIDGGTVTIPGQTAAVVYLGTITSLTLSTPPTPITDAQVNLTANGGSPISLPGDAGGTYTQTSVQNSGLQYQSGATYDFNATESSNTYVGEVSQVPQVESISAFHPPQGFISAAANQPFSFTRPSPPSGGYNVGFVTVFPVDDSGHQGNPTYTNAPQTPLDFLKLVAAPGQWQQPSVTVPGTAFPNSQTTYAIVFESVKNGGPKSNNLFTGSALLAGSADVGILRTQ
jgi:hypothetical protein